MTERHDCRICGQPIQREQRDAGWSHVHTYNQLAHQPVPYAVIEHRVCLCGHGENEHYTDDCVDRDEGEALDASFCEGCVETPANPQHRFSGGDRT